MDLNKTTATKRLGLIIAAILTNTDPNRSANNENDLREQKQAENPSSNPDPELEDPNFVPDEADDQDSGLNEDALEDEDRDDRRDRDDLIDPIDPLNQRPDESDIDPDDEDPLELPEQDEDELEEIEPDDELPVEEKDDLGQDTPSEFPEEDQDELLEERDFSDQNNNENKDFDHNDQDLEAEGLETEDNRGNFL